MIHRHPRSLLDLRRTPKSSTSPPRTSHPPPTQHLPKNYHEIYGPYNTVCEFLRRTVSPHDKAEPVEIHTNVIFFSTPENFAMNLLYDLNHRMHLGYSIAGQIISYLFET